MKRKVSIIRYERPKDSVRDVIDKVGGIAGLNGNTKVFIKPNIVFWTSSTDFPKWGVITTSRVIEDIVLYLKEMGIKTITIGEGIVTPRPKDYETVSHAFEYLGYNILKKRYGINVINIFERPFRKIDFGDGITLNINQDALESDLIVNVPVLKTHAQAIVSLGIKNLKGLIDIESRKRCHSPDPVRDLNFMISLLPVAFERVFTLIDGIFSLERGPGFDGKARRSNILVASEDIYSADKVGSLLLGYQPSMVPHLRHALERQQRPLDLEDTEVIGESIESLAHFHEYSFPYTKDNSLPLPLYRLGIKGLRYPKYDSTICTYCSQLNGIVLYSISRAYKGEELEGIEILTGKTMRPLGGMKKTILLGKCMYQLNKGDPGIQEMIAVKGCPPEPKRIVEALKQVGLQVDPIYIENPDLFPGIFMSKYQGRDGFEEGFFKVG